MVEEDHSSTIRSKEFARPSIRTQHLAELVCPVCYEYMQPPIMMCEKGHCICSLCHELMSECPQCGGELTYRRSSTLEALTAVLMFPCKHCGKRYSLEDMETHKCFETIEGDHSPTATCIIGQVYGDCLWSGPSTEMIEHCSKQHPYNYWTHPENFALWNQSESSGVGVQHVFIIDLTTAFFVIVQKFNSKGTLSWNLSCECTNNDRYDYEIKFFSDEECVLTSERTKIENAFSILTFFPGSNEITVEIDKVSKYLNENNVIKYKIAIYKLESDNKNSIVLDNLDSTIVNNNDTQISQKDEKLENFVMEDVIDTDKPNCISKTWSSVITFYNSVKKYFHK